VAYRLSSRVTDGVLQAEETRLICVSTLAANAVPANAQGYQMRYVYSYP
jgi:hypothetical protein